MALKLNIRPEIEQEMEALLPQAHVRSKTEYINRAIQELNAKVKRLDALESLRKYFQSYRQEGQEVLSEFSRIKKLPD